MLVHKYTYIFYIVQSVRFFATPKTEAGFLVRKLSQLTRSAKLSGLTPGSSSCSEESVVS
jgi:hypothetical protein